MSGEELDRGPAIPIITDFVSSELARLEQLHPRELGWTIPEARGRLSYG